MKATFSSEEKFVLAIILKAIIEQDPQLVLTNYSLKYRLEVSQKSIEYLASPQLDHDCTLIGLKARNLLKISPLKAKEIYSLLFPSRGRRKKDYTREELFYNGKNLIYTKIER